jgi:ATP-dependent DNA helicase
MAATAAEASIEENVARALATAADLDATVEEAGAGVVDAEAATVGALEEEERRLTAAREEEERLAAEAAKPVKKLSNAREREKVNSLNKLLSQSSMYADFLSQKLPQMVKKDGEPDAKRAKTNSTNADFFKADLVKEELRGYQKGVCSGWLPLWAEAFPPLAPPVLSPPLLDLTVLAHCARAVSAAEGVLWLRSLYENGLHGILADEMGLGKTVQIISFLAHLKAHKSWGPVLIIGPLSVLSNWDLEITRWTGTVENGGLEHYVYHGDKKSREEMRAKYFRSSRSMSSEERVNQPVIITSFEIAMADAKFLLHTNWFYLVVDEGHRLKNMNCKLIKQLKLLKLKFSHCA